MIYIDKQKEAIRKLTDEEKKIYAYIVRYNEKLNRFPTKDKIKDYAKKDDMKLKLILDKLRKYKLIGLNNSRYYVVDYTQISKESKLKNKLDKVSGDEYYSTIIKVALVFIKIICLFAGIVSLFVSIFYSFLWFQSFMPVLLAGFFGAAFPLFAVGMYEAGTYSKKNKLKRVRYYFVIWSFAAAVSMIGTVAGQYNESRNKTLEIKKKNHKQITMLSKYNRLQKQINDATKKKKYKENFIKQLDNTIYSDMKLEDYSEYKSKNGTIETVEKQKGNIEKEIIELDTKIEVKVKEQNTLLDQGLVINDDKGDFFKWAAEIISKFFIFSLLNIKIDSFTLQFIIFTLPAIFTDIMSPLSFSVVMFLGNKEE